MKASMCEGSVEKLQKLGVTGTGVLFHKSWEVKHGIKT